MRSLWIVISAVAVIGEVCCYPPRPCSLCSPGMFLTQMCSLDADTKCLPCPEGTFSATASHLKQCSSCSECPQGMYKEKPCQTVTDTLCAPCPVVPGVRSDYLAASCDLGNDESTRTDLDLKMMADAPDDTENADTSENQAVPVDYVAPEDDNKDTGETELLPDQDGKNNGYNHNEAENAKEVNKEILEKSPTVPDISNKDFGPSDDLADTSVKDNGQTDIDTKERDTDKDQSNQDNELNEKENLIALPVKEEESKDTTKSTHDISLLDEARLGAVKVGDDEGNDNKRQMNDELNYTPFIPHIEESRSPDSAVRNDDVNNADGTIYEGTQADAPVEHGAAMEDPNVVNVDNMTDHHGESVNDTADVLHSVSSDSSHVHNEDSQGRKRAAIILGLVIAGLTFFALLFFATRCLRGRKQRKFKDMKKVNSYDQESVEIQPLSYTATGSPEDSDPEETQGLHRQGPPVGPSSPRKTQPTVDQSEKTQPTVDQSEKTQPTVEQSESVKVQAAPETSMTIPVLTVSRAPDDSQLEDIPESLSDHEPLVDEVGQIKYIDESTDDEYVMRVLNKVPFSRLSHLEEEPLSRLGNFAEEVVHPSTQQTSNSAS